MQPNPYKTSPETLDQIWESWTSHDEFLAVFSLIDQVQFLTRRVAELEKKSCQGGSRSSADRLK